MSALTRRSMISLAPTFVFASMLSPAIAQDKPVLMMPGHSAQKQVSKTKIGMDGYCPVCITDMKKWMKGKKEFSATYDGVTYYFPGDVPKQKFLKSPEKYVPALNGDCIACYAMAKKRIPGNVRHASRYRGRIYLFPGDKEKQVFMKNPKKFENIDLACDGKCSVCKTMGNKDVAGRPEFTAMHDGFRYLFPSDKERKMFLKEPAKFADKTLTATAGKPAAMFTVMGKTGCAACSHGVHPIHAPRELGLAVVSPDGKVFVIEDAHSRWPTLYKDRFEEKSVRVTGTVIKQAGKFAWIKPDDLVVL